MLNMKQILVLTLLIGTVLTVDFELNTTPEVMQQSSSEELLIVGIPFDCTNKPTGFYKDTNYCDIFHVCVSFQQRKTYGCPQIGDQFFYDENLKMCEFKSRNPNGCPSNNYYQQVQPTQYSTSSMQDHTTEPIEPWKEFTRLTDQFTCQGKPDGFYSSRWCNVFYRCSTGVKFEFLCAKQQNGERLWWTEHSKSNRMDTAECGFPCDINTVCSSPGGILVEAENGTVITESLTKASQIFESCNATSTDLAIDHNNDVFRLPHEEQSETSCIGKPDGIFQGDDKYCNVFHVCYAGTKRDFLCAKALNSEYELWWDATRNRCDWPCKVKCNRQVFGGNKSAAEIQRVDRIINAADCRVTLKSFKYTFMNRAFNGK